MSWLYSRALVAAYSAGTCSDGEQSAPSSGNPTPLAYCAPDKMTAFSRLSRFGTTFKPLTASHGEGVLTSFLADFPALTFPPQEKAQGSTAKRVGCGSTWHESLARFDPVSRLWRTPQCSLLEGLDEFSATWPRWGMMRDGVSWAQSTPVRRINVSESGSWPTPTASAGGVEPAGKTGRKLATMVAMWPTPTVQDAANNGAPSQMERNTKPLNAEVGGSLNPTWVEWLMGWSLGWTDLKPLETVKFQQWQHSHGKPYPQISQKEAA